MENNLKFYTNVSRIANSMCYRGYENGVRVSHSEQFKPTLYLSNTQGSSGWKSLEGRPLDPMQFDSMKDAAEFVAQYKDVESMGVYGNNN